MKKRTQNVLQYSHSTVLMSLFGSLASASPESSVEVKKDPPSTEIVN